jgi:glycosyltransferase involved in cell wall biosynthesis
MLPPAEIDLTKSQEFTLFAATSATKTHPLVSVVIPAYNASATLTDTLHSLARQNWPALEVIVVDDGSTDATWELLQRTELPVLAIHQVNQGLAGARNTGLAAARGEFIALLDADDLCEPERLALQVACLQAHPDMQLCCSDFSAFNESGLLSASHAASYYGAIGERPGGIDALLPQRSWLDGSSIGPDSAPFSVARGNAYAALTHGNFVHPPTIMFRREVLAEVGNFDANIGSMCDWDWIVRVARSGEIGYIDRPLLQYRLSGTQMSSARYRARAQPDILRVAEQLVQRDPALYQAERPRFDRELGQMCLNAADALADINPARARHLLLRAASRYRIIGRSTARVAIKSLLPRGLIEQLRQRRSPEQLATR